MCTAYGPHMDPRLLDPDQWEQISRAVVSVYLFVGLAVAGSLALLLDRAVLASLLPAPQERGQASQVVSVRRALSPLAAASLGLAAVALAWGIYLAVGVLLDFYPRLLI